MILEDVENSNDNAKNIKSLDKNKK